MPSGDQRALLVAYLENGDVQARDRLVEELMPLVRSLANRYAGRGEPTEDLIQVGAIGLVKAIDRFELEKGVELSTYAVPTIVGEIRRHLRDSTQPLRVPRRNGDQRVVVQAVALDADAPSSRDARAERGLELGEERALIEAGMRALPRRQRRIVQLHYFANLSQRGIADELGLSQVHVSRLLHDSLGKLRQEIGQT